MLTMDASALSNNIAKLRQRVRLSAEKSQRKECDIRILAASKTRDANTLKAASELGLRDFGENYLQEALVKIEQLQALDICWHFIGPMQSNKTRPIAEHFDWVHSVDRAKIARRLSEQRPEGLKPLQVCLQVNVSNEASKSGVSLDELAPLVEAVAALPNIVLRGLMAIPEASDDTEVQRGAFRKLHTALLEMQALAPTMDTLSMGMSGDLEAAIAEGATMVRIGTDIFGPRD
ncbi:MAG: YggS family pyridoxal phosphate-dependent enzyme [Halieaceae bacterium]